MTDHKHSVSGHRLPNGIVSMIREFLRIETTAGFILVIMAVLAMVVANSPLAGFYHSLLNETYFTIGFLNSSDGIDFELSKTVLHWINDGMMAVFFFLVGLEIKREFREGELSSRERALIPFLAAAGGMAVPALVFLFFNASHAEFAHGWAIPSATDIAFTLGVLALLGPRVPMALKVMITAIAVIDDLGAIIVIALFYGEKMDVAALAFAGSMLAVLFIMNRLRVCRPAAYILVGLVLWVCVLKSGVHATLAGVVTALFIPMRNPANPEKSPVIHLEHILHPWVAFMVLPIFAFANAGVSLGGVTFETLSHPVVLGVVLGLFIGKQLGIFGVLYAAIKAGLMKMPEGVTYTQLYGASILCGIGFTMSLFIGGLAYSDAALQVEVRVGVILGSILSAAVGYLILKRATPRH